MWACQQFVLLKFLSNLNLNMVYGTFYVNHDVSKGRFSCLLIYIKPWLLVILFCVSNYQCTKTLWFVKPPSFVWENLSPIHFIGNLTKIIIW